MRQKVARAGGILAWTVINDWGDRSQTAAVAHPCYVGLRDATSQLRRGPVISASGSSARAASRGVTEVGKGEGEGEFCPLVLTSALPGSPHQRHSSCESLKRAAWPWETWQERNALFQRSRITRFSFFYFYFWWHSQRHLDHLGSWLLLSAIRLALLERC